MALNPSAVGKKDTECTETGELHPDGGEPQKNSAATSATANQNGDQAGCGDSVMPEQEAPERRRSAQTDARSFSSSPLTGQRPNEELPRRNFQIPRKIRERKGLYQFLPPDSREFEDLVKIISSFYLDASSRGTFSYCKARLIHNELLEKEFIEKRREMKQEGRTEQELTESYCFLYPDKSKLQWICEKGLSVGHSRITTLGNPSVGVYLSKYSDLLQINPFEVGSFGDMIVFKVMRGRIKHIHENMPKNAMEPTPKFDCHLSKSANRVTSLLSYRAFELTQQYFFEFAFDEIKPRPRHICPYAVVSFQYKGKEAAAAPMTAHRFNTISPEGSRGKNCYTVWSGPLVNKGQELFPICLRSSSRPYLPFKLPEKLEVSRGMQLEQVKRKIPSVLFSWDTYRISREVMKCGMFCSLFDVVDGKGKPTSGSLAALVNKLERDRMVLVKSLFDRGFLFLLSSAQMVETKERRGRAEKNLQALFIFQESRMVVKYSSRLFEPEPLTVEPQPAILSSMEPFVPALHYALFKLRPNPGKDLSSGVERQATDYLTRMDSGTVRPFILPDYKYNVDDRTNPLPVPRPKFNMDAVLRSYVHNPANYMLPLNKAKDIIERIRNPVPIPAPAPAPVEYSPVSDWGGSDRGSDRAERPAERLPQERPPSERPAQEKPTPDSSRRRPGPAHSNGAQPQHKPHNESQPQPQRLRLSQNEYDKDKMKQLLKLIQLHKKALIKDPGKERGEDGAWDANNLKRKFEGDERGGINKHQRTDPLSNGEPSRGAQAGEMGDEGVQSDNLTAVMESMGIYDTDLRARGNANSSAVNETQRLLKILLATLNKAVAQGSMSVQSNHGEPSTGSGRGEPSFPDPDLKKQNEPASQTNYTEEDMDCSPGSPFSTGSPSEQAHTSDNPSWVLPVNEDKAQPFPEPEPEPEAAIVAESHPEPKTPAVVEVKKAAATPTLPVLEEVPFRPSISLDTILNQEIHSLTSDIKNIMQTHHICYTSQLPPRLPPHHCWLPNSCFSNFVVPYVSPVPFQGHVKALCEKMDKLIPDPPAPSKVTSPPPPMTTSNLTTPSPAPIQTSKTKTEPSPSKSTTSSQSGKVGFVKDSASTKVKTESASTELGGEIYSPSQVTPGSPEGNSQNPGSASGSGSGLLAGSLIGQLKPEVFSSLVEIFKDVTKNTVKFYIYSGDEGEESSVCKEIKEYLKSLGNSECSPQTFLENSGSLDKLLIIIQNEDIAAHVHKIPALVSLKKLPSVSFAGVDTLDDVKNHTYNELFVSGGFMVSDEFVLNPDLITQDRLQGLLNFLEEQSTPEHPWQWKVHCKSQKKLKELGRLNTNAMGLLNLLTAYQKKHLVEFLPYHECDTQSRQAPDLECLIKLQAQHTQQRHLIFLTERPFEMFLQYSRNGIVIASIDDVMSGFHSLIGSINQNELPTPPSTVVNDECVEEEDMSLDSDDGEPPTIANPLEQNSEVEKEKPPQPPPPDKEEFRPPLPDHQVTPERTPTLSEYSAFKTAISQFKATNQIGIGSSDIGSLSPGGFPVNPHQSFLCPSASWSSYTGSSSYAASPAYPASPCSSTQEQEYRPPATASVTHPTPPVMATPGPLANLASLPMEVKPPPPPHLMMLGHTYGSDTGGVGATGKSPLTTSLPYTDHSDTAQPGYMAGIPKNASGTPTQHDRTLSGPGEGIWSTAGTSTCETGSGQGVVTSGLLDPSGLPKTGETLGGSTPGSQGGRTQVNCADNLGPSVGISTVATRGGSVVRPKLPPHPMCGVGYGSIGGIPGQMDHGPMRGAMGPGSLGNYRGRGIPPGLWPRPGRGHERGDGTGGGPCSWGYPAGRGGAQDYYSDYTYSHNYAPE
ncbi:protein TASOR-like isoform X1 [Seriola lalandi dorsalis]|uniref:Transcription activation suppressor b n=1 Tax=Seriola lalandi dorsalis TaxID=1841481 RepID=A0A3B4W9Y5_SERLL|nr:protein TASOR-like isoform X1 [Seriola lalandi dorsalis]